ncbi:permease for cytosine/purines, uracil, thiamine, allantoin-domain-containing protein [Suillus clintonianus]|uniref:permease for cytosine/purines, uracil, thiamine, allantoin-domain-containing protein n=1 Tax=Suillus clintonianus TaxID=1904413 RepID=UPI001B87BCD4|nr:permease for cytosine/purines, uracil, thiamine, allantoin-domain-containing protein [Suillus clintonianus]KAG2135332.1 permease for cytosine/purines, uracil, thiamine, allantoin-domain-containing protein [Suillus clintonianus]
MQSNTAEQKQTESNCNSSPYLPSDEHASNTNDLEKNHYHTGLLRRTTQLLSRYGIETHGIAPVPAEARLETRWYQMFFVWFSSNMNILGFSTGTAGPAFFSLGIRQSISIIVIVNMIVLVGVTILLWAFLETSQCASAVFGPKLGVRAMVQARFSWGYFGAIIPAVLNVLSLEGFLILNCIIGGQTIASFSSQLDDNLGIVIIGIISLVVTFCGYRVIHWYESIAWIPNVIAFITMVSVGYPQLRENLSVPVPPATPANVISFASFLASDIVTWCTMIPDYGVYHSPDTSSARIFIYTYLGFFVSNVTSQALGAAFAAAAPNVPAWNAGFNNSSSAGGLLYSVLLPTGVFGKILIALVALSIPSACAPTMYTFSTSFMAVATWFAAVPRWVYILVSEGILIPLAIIGAKSFYATFVEILDIVGYWSSAFAAIILTEHVLFRRASFSEDQYPITTWASYNLLPSGIPAVVAFVCACGALIPFMSQAWYVGPVARQGSGDLGVFVAFVVGAIAYALARGFENRWYKKISKSDTLSTTY